MNISPISSSVLPINKPTNTSIVKQYNYNTFERPCDMITFCSVGHGGVLLKKLTAFGVPDMYTGRMMLDSKTFEQWQKTNLFSKPIKKVLKITKHYKKTLAPIEAKAFSIIEKEAKKTPHDTLESILKRIKPEYEKILLSKQQPIFEELIQTACKMPKDRFYEFMKLMNVTSKKLENNPVILPFSEREFRYKLFHISHEIDAKNDKKEIFAMNKLKRMASYLFDSEKPTSRFVIKNSKIKKYVRNQKTASAIKRNTTKLNQMHEYFQTSPLKDNKELCELFQDARARIYGFPTIEPFKRKPFIHDLSKITDTLENKELAREMQKIAVKLPRAKDDISAFIVKTSGDTNDKIGYNIFAEAICSIDHLKPVKSGGKSSLGNYGLCSKSTNSEKSNTSFATWIEKNPETRINIQKYVDRMISLYKNGVFKHLGLKRTYIEDFANTVSNLTQKNSEPLILNLSKLKGFSFFGS